MEQFKQQQQAINQPVPQTPTPSDTPTLIHTPHSTPYTPLPATQTDNEETPHIHHPRWSAGQPYTPSSLSSEHTPHARSPPPQSTVTTTLIHRWKIHWISPHHHIPTAAVAICGSPVTPFPHARSINNQLEIQNSSHLPCQRYISWHSCTS